MMKIFTFSRIKIVFLKSFYCTRRMQFQQHCQKSFSECWIFFRLSCKEWKNIKVSIEWFFIEIVRWDAKSNFFTTLPKTYSRSHNFIPESQELKYTNNFLIGRFFWPKKFIWQATSSFGNPAIEQLPNFWYHSAINSGNFRKENLLKKQFRNRTFHSTGKVQVWPLCRIFDTHVQIYFVPKSNAGEFFFRKKMLSYEMFLLDQSITVLESLSKSFFLLLHFVLSNSENTFSFDIKKMVCLKTFLWAGRMRFWQPCWIFFIKFPIFFQ